MSYAYHSDLEYLEERVEYLEEVIDYLFGGKFPEFDPKDICVKKGHKYKRIEYDLQGGKWGKERCERCGDEYSWSV